MIDSQDDAFAREMLAKGPFDEFGGRLAVRCFKLRADGALGSRGALLLLPYDDDPKNSGLNVQLPESLLAWTRAALKHGFRWARCHRRPRQPHRARYLRTGHARDGKQDMRLRVEHAQILSPDDIPRFAALGVVASMQPRTRRPTCRGRKRAWVQRGCMALTRGARCSTAAPRWHSLGLSRGVGGPAPGPLRGCHAPGREGNPPGGWFRDQTLTLDQALRAFTIGAAYARFDEKDAA
jgi:predicted amidohydrolase YtcJ